MRFAVESVAKVQVAVDVSGWPQPRVARLCAFANALAAEVDDTAEPANDWTSEALNAAFDVLMGRGAIVQLAIVRVAIAEGGFLTRERVYEVANYSPGRSLKGFTRPTNAATQTVKDLGLIPQDASALLVPRYDQSSSSFQRTQGFSVPAALVRLDEE